MEVAFHPRARQCTPCATIRACRNYGCAIGGIYSNFPAIQWLLQLNEPVTNVDEIPIFGCAQCLDDRGFPQLTSKSNLNYVLAATRMLLRWFELSNIKGTIGILASLINILCQRLKCPTNMVKKKCSRIDKDSSDDVEKNSIDFCTDIYLTGVKSLYPCGDSSMTINQAILNTIQHHCLLPSMETLRGLTETPNVDIESVILAVLFSPHIKVQSGYGQDLQELISMWNVCVGRSLCYDDIISHACDMRMDAHRFMSLDLLLDVKRLNLPTEMAGIELLSHVFLADIECASSLFLRHYHKASTSTYHQFLTLLFQVGENVERKGQMDVIYQRILNLCRQTLDNPIRVSDSIFSRLRRLHVGSNEITSEIDTGYGKIICDGDERIKIDDEVENWEDRDGDESEEDGDEDEEDGDESEEDGDESEEDGDESEEDGDEEDGDEDADDSIDQHAWKVLEVTHTTSQPNT